jgi:hypothetical protein
MTRYVRLICVCLTISFSSQAQTFTEIDPNIQGVNQGNVMWGDYDNDSDLDAFVFGGGQNFDYFTFLYRNEGGNFEKVFPDAFVGLVIGDCDWGDYDNDGDLDIVISASTDSSPQGGITKIFQNNGIEFLEVYSGQINGFIGAAVAWGDYDCDGDLDLAIGGEEAAPAANNPRNMEIYENTGTGFEIVYQKINNGIKLGSADWGDYDNDGDLDLLVTGFTFGNNSFRTTHIIKNTASGFEKNETAQFLGVGSGSGRWGDYDNDGDLDILINGSTYENNIFDRVTKIYQNVDGTFQLLNNDLFIGTEEGEASWGDYDDDGDLDIAIIGRLSDDFTELAASVYENTGDSFTFLEELGTGVRIGSLAWGDYDNDGDTDIMIGGQDGVPSTITRIYRNNRKSKAFGPNTVPEVPTNLSTEINGDEIKFSWDMAHDNETDEAGLSYNLYLRIGNDTLITPQSRLDGTRKIVKEGNTGSLTTYKVSNLEPGIYYWSVQTIDNSFSASAYAPEQSFEIEVVTANEEEISNNEVYVFPNPATNGIKISVKNRHRGELSIHLSAVTGTTFFQDSCYKNTDSFVRTISTFGMPAGLYFLTIMQEGKHQNFISKIILR